MMQQTRKWRSLNLAVQSSGSLVHKQKGQEGTPPQRGRCHKGPHSRPFPCRPLFARSAKISFSREFLRLLFAVLNFPQKIVQPVFEDDDEARGEAGRRRRMTRHSPLSPPSPPRRRQRNMRLCFAYHTLEIECRPQSKLHAEVVVNNPDCHIILRQNEMPLSHSESSPHR